MKIRCPSCKAAYDMDGSRVPAAGVNIKCPKCQFAFRVTKEGVANEGAAVPLPAPGGMKPPAAPAPAAPAPAAPAAAPAPVMPPGWASTTHPGQDAPRHVGDAVPLPGLRSPPIAQTMEFAAIRPPAPQDPGLEAAAAGYEEDPYGMDVDFGGSEQSFPAPAAAPASNPYARSAEVAASGAGNSGPQTDDFAMLDFVDENRAPAVSSGWQVRRQSGKVFGPFETGVIVTMLQQGQLAGNESVSRDGLSWLPIASEPEFATFIRKGPPGMAESGGGRVPPPMMGAAPPVVGSAAPPVPVLAPAAIPGDTSSGFGDFVEPDGEPSKPALVKKPARRGSRKLLVIVGGLVVVGGAAYAVTTFVDVPGLISSFSRGSGKAKPPKAAESAGMAIGDFDTVAGEGTFRAWQNATGLAEGALSLDPASEEARTLLALSSSRLMRRYQDGKASFERAKTLSAEMGESGPNARLARAAVAFGSGESSLKVKSFIESDTRLRAQALIAEAHVLGGEFKSATKVIDALDSSLLTPDLLLLKARAALELAETEAAEKLLTEVQEKSPGHVTARLMLAELRVRQKKDEEAQALLAEVLVEPASLALDAGEEARGHALLGEMRIRARDFAGASAAYTRATELEPSNTAHRGALAWLELRQGELEKAVTAFASALEENKNDPQLLSGYGRALTLSGQYVKAHETLESARKVAPKDTGVLVAAGDLQLALGKLDDAALVYAEALEAKADDVPALVAAGRVALLQKKTERASELLEKAVELAPRNAEAQGGLGLQRLAAGDAAGARDAFNTALSLDPSLAFAQVGLGDALVALGADAEARTAYEKSVTLEPKSVPARLRLAQLLRRMGDGDAALAQISTALEAEPKNPGLLAAQGSMQLSLGQLESADASLRLALGLDDRSAEAHEAYGKLLYQKGELSLALEHLTRATELDPKAAGAYYALGQVHAKVQRLVDAAKAYRLALGADPLLHDAREQLGAVLAAQGGCEEASGELSKVLEQQPKRATTLALLGDCDLVLQKNDQALAHFRQALELDASLVTVHYKLGRVYEKLGRMDEAVRSYQQATRHEATNPWPHLYLGYAYKAKNARKDAIASFEKYLELSPDARDAKDIREEIFYLKEFR